MPVCPNCHGCNIKKNGRTYYGKQNHKCKDCGRQFVEENNHTIGIELREIARRCLLERISLRGTCRLLGVSLTWLMSFAVKTWRETPGDLGANPKLLRIRSKHKLKLIGFQMDEMWSFVGEKRNKAWIWVVYEPDSKQFIAFHIGGRGIDAAKSLWAKIPLKFKEQSTFETDYWESYKAIIPSNQHIVGKEYTYFIEGIFATVRARVSRLVRKSLSFSKKRENHEAAIGYFFWQMNLTKQPYI